MSKHNDEFVIIRDRRTPPLELAASRWSHARLQALRTRSGELDLTRSLIGHDLDTKVQGETLSPEMSLDDAVCELVSLGFAIVAAYAVNEASGDVRETIWLRR